MEPLKTTIIDQVTRHKLYKAGIKSIDEIIKARTEDLLAVDLSMEDVVTVKLAAANVFDMLFHDVFLSAIPTGEFLSTGCIRLDKSLGGGFRLGCITELNGEPDTGKSQLCMQLCLAVQFPEAKGGLDGGAVYVCPSKSFPSARFVELSTAFVPAAAGANLAEVLRDERNFGDNVYIAFRDNVVDLLYSVQFGLEKLFTNKPNIRLVIIDSLSEILRQSNLTSGVTASLMEFAGSYLESLAAKHRVAVVVVDREIDTGDAAPGLQWSAHVTTRLRTTRYVNNLNIMSVDIRPYMPIRECLYKLTKNGVFKM